MTGTEVQKAVEKLGRHVGASTHLGGILVVRGRYESLKWRCEVCRTSGNVSGKRDLVYTVLARFVTQHAACTAEEDTKPL